MPRVSADEKERSHMRIVQEASLLLRAQGIENTSVTDVMSAAGLTHGGFYRHFKSKDDLVAAALRFAIRDAMSDLEAATTSYARTEALWQYVDLYLSLDHVHSTRSGCPLAAMSVDAVRGAGAVREAADQEMQYVLSLLSRTIGDSTEAEDQKARALLALLVGTVSLARVSRSDEDAEELLRAARKSLALLLPPRMPP